MANFLESLFGSAPAEGADTPSPGLFGRGGLLGESSDPDTRAKFNALGMALLSSPRYSPLQNLPKTMELGNTMAQQNASQDALALALQQYYGFPPAIARKLAANPAAAQMAAEGQESQRMAPVISGMFNQGGPAQTSAPAAPQIAPKPEAAAPGMLSPGSIGGGGYTPSILTPPPQLQDNQPPLIPAALKQPADMTPSPTPNVTDVQTKPADMAPTVAQRVQQVESVRQTPNGPVFTDAQGKPLFNITGMAKAAQIMSSSPIKRYQEWGKALTSQLETMQKTGTQFDTSGNIIPVPGAAESAARAESMKPTDAMKTANAAGLAPGTPEYQTAMRNTMTNNSPEHAAAIEAEKAPYQILSNAARLAASPHELDPSKALVTGAQINPQLDAALKWATGKIPGMNVQPVAPEPPGQPAVSPFVGGAPALGGPQMPREQAQGVPQQQTAAQQQAPAAWQDKSQEEKQSEIPGLNPKSNPFIPHMIKNPDGSVTSSVTGETAALAKQAEVRFNKGSEAFDAAQTAKSQLNMMQVAADQLNKNGGWTQTGQANQMRMTAAKGINTLASVFNIDPANLPFSPEKVADWEQLNKLTKTLGFKVAASLGSRESTQVINNAISSVPNAENTPMGFALVKNGIQQGLQREADLHEFQVLYLAKNHTLFGSDIAFAKLHPPEEYSNRAIADARAAMHQPTPAQPTIRTTGTGVQWHPIGQ